MDLIEYLKHLSGKDIKIKSVKKNKKKIIEEEDDISTIDEAIFKINRIKKMENKEIKYDLEF